MNYYEELGLPPSASPEEIRQAYKSLARLLHPDRQSDTHLRKMAELQMTRLNDILAELSDPVRRQRYDAMLQANAAGNVTGAQDRFQPRALSRLMLGRLRPSPGAIVWGGLLMLAAVGFAFVFLYFEHDPGMAFYHPTEDSGRQTPAPAKVPDRITAPATTHSLSPLPAGRPTGEVTRAAGRNEEPSAPAPLALPPPAPISNTAQHFETAQLRPATDEQEQMTTTKPAATLVHPLIGTWLYVKSKTEEGANKNFAYRPEYIEMIIKPGQKGVCGKYRGQFHVPDRPLSSEVVLRFEGAAGEGTNIFTWQGDDGASGEIRMKLVSDGVVDVSWYTTRFGNAQKLASGTAMLHRD